MDGPTPVPGPSSPKQTIPTHPTSGNPATPNEQPAAVNTERKRKRGKGKRGADGADGGPGTDEPRESWSTPWIDTLGVTEYERKDQRLHDEIVAFASYILPTADERHVRAMVIARICELALARFQPAKIDTFGSVAQNLYLPNGDTDLVITTTYELTDQFKKRALFQLAATLKNARVTNDVHVIHRARVPVVSFCTVPELGSMKVDISFNATDGIKAVPVIREYFERMPALRFLVLAIKCLLTRHELNSASNSGLSSYGVILLAINFLQINPMERPIEFIEKPLENESLGVLLTDFLDYYADKFDYTTSYVSVAQGKTLPKEAKGWANPKHPDHLCIECIMNPDNDVARPTSKIKHIRSLFHDSSLAIQTCPFPTERPDILGSIIAISEQTLAHRERLKDIVASGKLTQALQETKASARASGPRRVLQESRHQPHPPRRPSNHPLPPRPPVGRTEGSSSGPSKRHSPYPQPQHPTLPPRPQVSLPPPMPAMMGMGMMPPGNMAMGAPMMQQHPLVTQMFHAQMIANANAAAMQQGPSQRGRWRNRGRGRDQPA